MEKQNTVSSLIGAVALWVLGVALVVGALIGSAGIASAQGITEDDPRWDCRYYGNQVCGPSSGHVPGQYAGGQLTLTWDQLLRKQQGIK